MRKSNSTNSINKAQLEEDCGMAYTISVLSGRWKLSILAYLTRTERMRYSELKKTITGISERMLINQLRELAEDGLIDRIAFPEVPPRVEYKLSSKGKSLTHILHEMSKWGKNNQE